jgi:4-diphosphocytidyl-2-C-methyl-D-erythritol kinase
LTQASGAAAVEVAARAKLNLYLHLLGRRADGYHDIDSLVAFAAFADRLSFAPGTELRLDVDGAFAESLPRGDDNLVLRAASLLQRRYGVTRGASIRLEKRIPVAAGLGGGSADAAAALQGLMQLWQLRAHPDELAAIALELGADVPVCLIGRAAFVGGAGEKVEPIGSLPELGLVLINPRVPLSTKAVFMSREGQFSLAARWTEPVRETEQLVKLLAQRHNDLTRPALVMAPVIGDVLTALSAYPEVLLARMSGSGATCYGLTRTRAEAESAAEKLRTDRPGWWVVATWLEGADAFPALDRAK